MLILLPRLQQRLSPLASPLLLGVLRALWHLPLWKMQAFLFADLNPFWLTADILAVSIMITWLFNHSEGNLWLSCLFHGIAAQISMTLPMMVGSVTNSIVGVVAAVLVIIVFYGNRIGPFRKEV